MNKRTVRKQAAAKGHSLGNFVTRKAYCVAWCQTCKAAAFAEETYGVGVNPALERTCEETQKTD